MIVPKRKNGALNTALLKNIADEILNLSAIKTECSLAEHLYAIENGVQNICICGNLKTFKGYAKGYSRTCGSKKCINTAYKSTLLDNYGVLNVFQLETVKSKSKQTNLEKYGHEHPTQSKQIKEKVKQTNLNRHGVEYIFKNKTFIDKREETNLKKYGFKHATQSNQIKNKTKESNLEKYSKHPSKIKENRHKSNTTRMLNEDIKNPSRELVRKNLKNMIINLLTFYLWRRNIT